MSRRAKPNEAAVCYNMGYKVSKPNQMRELTSVRLKSGVLNTDYDCFFMWGPDNHFNSEGDGGYINVSHCYKLPDHSNPLTRPSSLSWLLIHAPSTARPPTFTASRDGYLKHGAIFLSNLGGY